MLRRSLVGALVAAPLARPAVSQTAYTPLFDGGSLNGWDVLGDANWGVTDGVISADTGDFSFLVSKQSYRDMDLRAEFWVSHDANSGIFIRCSDRERISATNAYEINIFDTRPDPSYGTGAIVNVAKVSPMPLAGGRWNVMEVRARGEVFSVTLNGQKTVDSARDAAHGDGPIALQYGAGVVKFRSVGIRAL